MRHATARAVTGTRFLHLSPVADIRPVEGWSLHTYADEDGDGFRYPEYVASGPLYDVDIPVSRFAFHPTQDRFAWLVRNGFHAKQTAHITGPWDDCDIDYALAAERQAVAA